MEYLFPRLALFRLPRRRKADVDPGNGPRRSASETLLRLVPPTIGLLLAGLLSQQEVYAGTGYDLSLLVALSVVGYAGYLANHVVRHHKPSPAACSYWTGSCRWHPSSAVLLRMSTADGLGRSSLHSFPSLSSSPASVGGSKLAIFSASPLLPHLTSRFSTIP
jgi:hypothetical protein